jgi:hypothetical protein
MQIQYVSKYLALTKRALLNFCANLDLDNNIYLYCLSCNYKKIIGYEFYSKISELVKSNEKSI